MTRRLLLGMLFAVLFLAPPLPTSAEKQPAGLAIRNGRYAHNGKAVWGLAQHNGWWRAGQRPNIARNAPGQVGPNRTEDLVQHTFKPCGQLTRL